MSGRTSFAFMSLNRFLRDCHYTQAHIGKHGHILKQEDNHEDKHKQKCSNPHKLSLIGRQSDGDNHYVASNLKHKKINPCYDVKEMFSLAMWLNVEYIESDGNLICD